MNPAEYNMLWMGQFPPERMVLDENSMLSVGMSVLDDMPHQHHSMDMNTMMMPLGEYNAVTAGSQLAIAPEIFPTIAGHHQLDPQQQNMLDQYTSMMNDPHASDDIVIQPADTADSDEVRQLHAQQQQQQQQHQEQLQLHMQQLQASHQQQQQHHLLGGGHHHHMVDDDEDGSSLHHYEPHHHQHHHQLLDDVVVGEDDGSGGGGVVVIGRQHMHEDLQQDCSSMSASADGGVLMDSIVASNSDAGSLIQIDEYHDGQQFDSDNSAHSFLSPSAPVEALPAQLIATSAPIMTTRVVQSASGVSGGRGAAVKSTQASNSGSSSSTTQTNKKIKPVKRPGLVLKTPIAYQPCLDPSVIPIQRDGMAVCERCGAIGVKHSFYTKERRFCSMFCARNELERLSFANSATSSNNQQQQPQTGSSSNNSSSAVQPSQQLQQVQLNGGSTGAGTLSLTTVEHSRPNYRFKITPHTSNHDDGSGIMYKDILPQDELPQITRYLPSPCPQDEKILSVRRKPSEFYNSYDWHQQLMAAGSAFFAADVTSFAHAPGCDMWGNIGVGMKVEVENTDCDTTQAPSVGAAGSTQTPHSFWVATVLRICGYKALIRYEGFTDDTSRDFWVNLCSSEVHPVGWCATRGKPLIPPRSIENRFADWKEFLVRHLSGARTLPSTFYNKIRDSFRSRFRTGLQLEVVDKNHISQVKLATVQKIVGKRLYVRYFDAPPDDNGFWCHEDSSLIHPVGWASTVGHNLSAPIEYLERMAGGPDQLIEACEDDSIIDLFRMNFTFEEYYVEDRPLGFVEGMKLEAVDPLNLSSICVATVMAVLKFGYMMIRIDSYEPDASGADWFCYHERSPCIFPPGFCHENGIVLTPPRGYEVTAFRWAQYLQNTVARPADRQLFRREMPASASAFRVGMKLECADLMDPRLVCVATVAKVVGRLLKVHFDGWEEEYDQWLDCESPDMYPVGWCVLVGHKLEGPRQLPKQAAGAAASGAALKAGGAKAAQLAAASAGQVAGGLAAAGSGTTAKRKRKKKVPKLAENSDKATNPNVQTRNLTVKKDREAFDQQRHTQELKQLIGNSSARGNTTIQHRQQQQQQQQQRLVKQEMKREVMEHMASHNEIDDDGYSYSTTSGHSTPLPMDTMEASVSANTIRNPSVLLEQQQLLNVRPVSAVAQQQHLQQLNKSLQSADQNPTASAMPRLSEATEANLASLQPISWSVAEVTQFLRANDCTAHGEAFARNAIDGQQLMLLTKDEIITMLDMKVGPSLKIFDLIQQLKGKLNPQQARMQKAAAAATSNKKNAYLA